MFGLNILKEKLGNSLVKQKLDNLETAHKNYLSILSDIDAHLEYQKDMLNESGIQNDMIVAYTTGSYRSQLYDKVISILNADNDEYRLFMIHVLLVDITIFKNIKAELYSEIAYIVIDMLSNRQNLGISLFTKDLYQHFMKLSDNEKSKQCIEKLKLYLKLSEAFALKTNKPDQQKQNTAPADVKVDKKTDNQEPTAIQNNKPGIMQIDNLFFQNNISTKKDLNRLFRRSSLLRPVIYTLLIAAAITGAFLHPIARYYVSPLIIAGGSIIVLGFLIDTLIAKTRKNALKRALAKVYTVACIGEAEVFESLQGKFGNKLKKLLRI